MQIHNISNEADFNAFCGYVKENDLKAPKFKIEGPLIKLDFGTDEEFHIQGKFTDRQKSMIIGWLSDLSPELFSALKNKRIIFGKNSTERIVSCEVTDGSVELFIEQPDGTVETRVLPNQHWMMSDRPLGQGWERLPGGLFFNHIKYYDEKSQLLADRRRYGRNELFSLYDDKEASMLMNGFTYFKGMKVSEVSVLAFDIESTGLNHDSKSKTLIISNTFRRGETVIRKLFTHDKYKNQGEMFKAWCDWVREMNPSILIGHNIYSYDLPYMAFCAAKDGYELELGRDGSPIHFEERESKFRKDGSQFYTYHRAHVYGREIVDTMFLAIKYDFSRKYENYRLKSIIAHEGLEVEGRQFYDAGTIAENYTNPEEWAKIIKYAEHDADDALAIYDLMVPSYFYLNQSVPKPFTAIINGASGSQINSILVRSYLQDYHSLPKQSPEIEYEGAISFGNPGAYKNVFKVDVASLYPSIMLEYKVFDPLKDPKAHFYKMVEYFTAERLHNKKMGKETGDRYYKDLQEAQKIIINSAYGMMGAPLMFNSPKNAAFVTEKGREILQKAIDWATSNNFVMVNADTDSIAFCAQGGDTLEPEVRRGLLSALNNLYPARIRFEDDGYYPAVLVIKAKNYVLFDGEKTKTKGSALKASMKEKALKEFINRVIKTLLDQKSDEILNIYHEYVYEINNLKDITRWASKKTVTDKVLNPERTNEQKVADAIDGSDYRMGDKCYFYFDRDSNLKLQEHWAGDHNVDKLMEKLHKSIVIFETVLDIKQFPKYFQVRQKEKLKELLQHYNKNDSIDLSA